VTHLLLVSCNGALVQYGQQAAPRVCFGSNFGVEKGADHVRDLEGRHIHLPVLLVARKPLADGQGGIGTGPSWKEGERKPGKEFLGCVMVAQLGDIRWALYHYVCMPMIPQR